MVTNHGSFDRKNTHYCSRENEHLYITARHQHRFGFNMWVAIFGTRIIVPSIYHETQTSERYRNSLENHLEEALDDLPIAEVQNCWFQQDGAPVHNSREVRAFLSLGRRGPLI